VDDAVETPTVAGTAGSIALVVNPTTDVLPGITVVEPTEAVESRTRLVEHPRTVPSASNFKTQTSEAPAPKDAVPPTTT
jgi:hypothetical protein